MSKAKAAIKKIENFIETLVDIQHNIETTGIITDEMKVLFHYIDEYNEMAGDMDNWYLTESSNSPIQEFESGDGLHLRSHDVSDCDVRSISAFGDDDYLENDKLNMADISDHLSEGSSDYMSDAEDNENDDAYATHIENVMAKSGLEYKSYINGKLLSKKLISKD